MNRRWLNNLNSPLELLCIQSIITVFGLGDVPAVPIVFKHFPVFKRFTYTSFLYALSRALMYVVTSFSFVYLIKYFGNWGMLLIMLPVAIGYGFGIFYFVKLEKEAGNYHVKFGDPQKSYLFSQKNSSKYN